jgi:site-specific recombinase XerD
LQLKEFVQSTKGKYLFNFAMRSEPGTNRYFKNGVRQIQRTLKKVKEDAGVQKNASPHKFRHSYATHLFQGGTDILKIKELLGHSNIANTLVYTHFTKVQVEDHANPLDHIN